MASGGRREGAGRKATGRNTVSVCWRVTPEVKDWVTNQASEQGVSAGIIIEELIKAFEELAQ